MKDQHVGAGEGHVVSLSPRMMLTGSPATRRMQVHSTSSVSRAVPAVLCGGLLGERA